MYLSEFAKYIVIIIYFISHIENRSSEISMMVSIDEIRAYGALLHVTRILSIDLLKKSCSDFLNLNPASFSCLLLFFYIQ